MVWNTTQKTKQGYGFTYDGLNRLTLGDHKSYTTVWVDNTKFEEKSLVYDRNGNILRLIRTDSIGVNRDDYKYNYKGNQLNQINALTAYTYDLNGNTTLDGLRGVSISYNILNLPKLVSKGTENIFVLVVLFFKRPQRLATIIQVIFSVDDCRSWRIVLHLLRRR